MCCIHLIKAVLTRGRFLTTCSGSQDGDTSERGQDRSRRGCALPEYSLSSAVTGALYAGSVGKTEAGHGIASVTASR